MSAETRTATGIDKKSGRARYTLKLRPAEDGCARLLFASWGDYGANSIDLTPDEMKHLATLLLIEAERLRLIAGDPA